MISHYITTHYLPYSLNIIDAPDVIRRMFLDDYTQFRRIVSEQVLFSAIIASLVAIAFLNKNIMVCIGYKFLALFVGLALLRLLFPFEFSFTDTVIMPPLLSMAISLFQCSWIPLGRIQISLWNLFEIVWMIGIIINLLYYIRNYCRSKAHIQKYGQDKTDDLKYKEALDSICAMHHKPNRFRVIELPELDTPLL